MLLVCVCVYIYVPKSCLLKILVIHCQDTAYGEKNCDSVSGILPSNLILAFTLPWCSMSLPKSWSPVSAHALRILRSNKQGFCHTRLLSRPCHTERSCLHIHSCTYFLKMLVILQKGLCIIHYLSSFLRSAFPFAGIVLTGRGFNIEL